MMPAVAVFGKGNNRRIKKVPGKLGTFQYYS